MKSYKWVLKYNAIKLCPVCRQKISDCTCEVHAASCAGITKEKYKTIADYVCSQICEYPKKYSSGVMQDICDGCPIQKQLRKAAE